MLISDYPLDLKYVEDLNNYLVSLRKSQVQIHGELSEGDTCSIQIGGPGIYISNSIPVFLSWIFIDGEWVPRAKECRDQTRIANPDNAKMIEAAKILNSKHFDVTPYKRISSSVYVFGSPYIFHAGCLKLLQADLDPRGICT